jgi:hypothetical protein
MMLSDPHECISQCPGTRDGVGAGDHDAPYNFGRRPCAVATYPFNTRQYVRLLLMRSRVHDDPVMPCPGPHDTGGVGARALNNWR